MWKAVLSCLDTQFQIQNTLDNCRGLFLPQDIAIKLQQLLDTFLYDYTVLHNDFFRREDMLFNLAPKFHWYWHLINRAQYLHPRVGHCFIDEDYMKTIKEIVRSCAHGTPLHQIPLSVKEKMRWARHVDMRAPPKDIPEGGFGM